MFTAFFTLAVIYWIFFQGKRGVRGSRVIGSHCRFWSGRRRDGRRRNVHGKVHPGRVGGGNHPDPGPAPAKRRRQRTAQRQRQVESRSANGRGKRRRSDICWSNQSIHAENCQRTYKHVSCKYIQLLRAVISFLQGHVHCSVRMDEG